MIANGANTINIHHNTEINPFINYPFLRPAEMKRYVDEAHAKGLKVKIYYTVRELTNHAPELYALLSLGHEVLGEVRREQPDRQTQPGFGRCRRWYVPAAVRHRHSPDLARGSARRWWPRSRMSRGRACS